jgi:hypothetical protein
MVSDFGGILCCMRTLNRFLRRFRLNLIRIDNARCIADLTRGRRIQIHVTSFVCAASAIALAESYTELGRGRIPLIRTSEMGQAT